MSRGIVFLSSYVMACVPQYLSDVHADLSRGTGQSVPQTRSAIEHLTRSRAVSRVQGSFSCRFLSWPVREGLPVSLYAISGRSEARNTRCVPRLHTPSCGCLSATPAPIPAGSTHAPLVVPYAAEGRSARRFWGGASLGFTRPIWHLARHPLNSRRKDTSVGDCHSPARLAPIGW